jgi:hypothetical protein
MQVSRSVHAVRSTISSTSDLAFQIGCDWKARPLLRSRYGGELREAAWRSSTILCDDVGIGKVGAVFEALKARPRLFGLRYGVFGQSWADGERRIRRAGREVD